MTPSRLLPTYVTIEWASLIGHCAPLLGESKPNSRPLVKVKELFTLLKLPISLYTLPTLMIVVKDMYRCRFCVDRCMKYYSTDRGPLSGMIFKMTDWLRFATADVGLTVKKYRNKQTSKTK